MPDRPLLHTRRDVVALGLGAFVVATLPFAARRRPRLVRRTLPVMGTYAELLVVDDRVYRAESAIDAAMRELTLVERTMTRFRADSDIGRANVAAGSGVATQVSAQTATVVAEALAWARASGGAFDPAIGRVVELWDVNNRHAPPPDESRTRLAGRELHRAVEVGSDGGAPALFIAASDVHLDLGGIAKGYGVDRAAEALRAHGVRDALVNVGGDLYAMGYAADGEPWRVGVRSPNDPEALAGTLDVTDCAIATSGDYEQFFRWRGQRYHHLMDPATAAPARAPMHSATVRAARCIDADAGATAVFSTDASRAGAVLATRGATLVSLG